MEDQNAEPQLPYGVRGKMLSGGGFHTGNGNFSGLAYGQIIPITVESFKNKTGVAVCDAIR